MLEHRVYASACVLERLTRTFAGFIGAWRMRTPVASKNAFATAEPIAAVGGSPEPESVQPSLNAAVLPAGHVRGQVARDDVTCTCPDER